MAIAPAATVRARAVVLENIGDEPVFSDFEVTNPQNGNCYRVAIRGVQAGENFCACPDFATNDLGTCKHIEFVLGKIENKRGGGKALARGFRPTYSEIYLRYGGERQVRFRVGAECPAAVAKRATKLFNGSPDGGLPIAHFGQIDAFVANAQTSGHELRCYEDALRFIAQTRDADERQRIIRRMLSVVRACSNASPEPHSPLQKASMIQRVNRKPFA